MTLIQRIRDLCAAIGKDLKTLKTAVDKNTAVNNAQDKNIKVSLEDPDRVKIVDFYHYDIKSKDSFLASGMTSLRLYHDKVYRLYFHDYTVSSANGMPNSTVLVFKLNHTNGGVIQLGQKPGTIPKHNTLNYYPCTISKDKKTLTKIPVFNQAKNLYFIPSNEPEFAISFENRGDSHKEFKAIEFFLNDQKYEVFLSKHRLPYQFSRINQPTPDFGIVQSLDNANLIRNSVGTHLGKENFSQFNTNPINFGRAEFYTRDAWANKQLDDYYYWDKNAKTYTIQMTLSQSFSEYTKTYAYIAPYDPDGLPIHAHACTEREPDVLLPESTPTRLVISDTKGSGLINYFNSINDDREFAFVIGGGRFIEENGELKVTDTHLCGAKINRQLSQAVIATGLMLAGPGGSYEGYNGLYTIDSSKNQVIIEFLNGFSIPEPILKLMQHGFSITRHADANCYYLPKLLNSSIPETPTPYDATISTVNPSAPNAFNQANRVFKNYAHYFKVGFLVNRFSNPDLPLEEYIEEQGKPLQFTIHSMKMSVNY